MRFRRDKKKDQADRLRKMFASSVETPAPSKAPPLVVVLGAKGGVGATTVTWQLTQALAVAEHTPLAIDAHIWQPDLARVAGITLDPGPTLTDVVAGDAATAAAVRIGNGPAVLPGSWNEPATIDNPNDFGPRLKASLVEQKKSRGQRFDWLVVDGGSARSPWAASLLAAADLVLLVTTPEQLALLGAYSFIKLTAASGEQTPIRLIVNRCIREPHARSAHASIRDACRSHLDTSLSLAGWLPHDAALATINAAPVPLTRPLCRRICEAIGEDSAKADTLAKAA